VIEADSTASHLPDGGKETHRAASKGRDTEVSPMHLIQLGSRPLARRTVIAGAITGLHVVAGFGLLLGTAIGIQRGTPPPITVVNVKTDDVVLPKTPPPPPVTFRPADVSAPPPLDIHVVGPDNGTAIVVPRPTPVEPGRGKPQPVADVVTPVRFTAAGRQTLADVCSARYPAASRRLGEEGVVRLLVYVAADGHVSEAKVETSSGYPRLDAANVECVRDAGRVFAPQQSGQAPTGAWQAMSYRWVLGN
jgi:periplasmic protein TonB